jgi:alanyl-tRNA synthetase
MTKRLYFDDPYRTEFDAKVVRRVDVGGRPGLILDETCFYPTAGGQCCDKGLLNDVGVVDVCDLDGDIVHVTTRVVGTDPVHGRIVWNRRFDFMQQHSGQHVLSQSLIQVLGADTVSAHLGEESSTIEIRRAALKDEEAREAEDLANRIVFENRAIKTYFVSADEVVKLPVRKIPRQEEPFRIVEVEGFDHSACGGTHCRHTGEIGVIKMGRWEHIRGNIRLQFLCGRRALEDNRFKSRLVESLSDRYSTGIHNVLDVVTKQAEENKQLRKTVKRLSEQTTIFEARDLLSKGVPCGEITIVRAVFDHRPFDEVKSLAMRMADSEQVVVLLGNRTNKGQLAFSCSEGLPYQMDGLIANACTILAGRGGGSPRFAFGGGPLAEKVDEAVQSAFELIQKGETGLGQEA